MYLPCCELTRGARLRFWQELPQPQSQRLARRRPLPPAARSLSGTRPWARRPDDDGHRNEASMTPAHLPNLLRSPFLYALGVLAVTAAVLAMLHSRPATPAWIASLRALPEVASVEFTGPADAG